MKLFRNDGFPISILILRIVFGFDMIKKMIAIVGAQNRCRAGMPILCSAGCAPGCWVL